MLQPGAISAIAVTIFVAIIITVVIVVFIVILLLRMRVRMMKADVLEIGPVTIQQDSSRSVSPISPSLPPIKRPSQRTLNMATAQRLDANWEVDFADLTMKERLGLGAFGEVWRADVSDDPSQARPTVVAVKTTKGQDSGLVKVLMCMCACVPMHMCMHVHDCVSVCVHAYMHACVCVCVYMI